MNEKRNLLITWTPYLFYNSIITQLKWLSKKFNITIGLASYHLSDEYVAIFDSLVSDNMIDRYFIIKTEKGVVSFYNSVKCEVKQLKTKKFDVWLTLSNIHIYEKYVEEFIIPSHCLKVIYSDSISYLLTSPDAYPLIHSSNCVEYDSLVKHDNTTKSVTDKFKVSVNKYGFLMTIQRIFNIGH